MSEVLHPQEYLQRSRVLILSLDTTSRNTRHTRSKRTKCCRAALAQDVDVLLVSRPSQQARTGFSRNPRSEVPDSYNQSKASKMCHCTYKHSALVLCSVFIQLPQCCRLLVFRLPDYACLTLSLSGLTMCKHHVCEQCHILEYKSLFSSLVGHIRTQLHARAARLHRSEPSTKSK